MILGAALPILIGGGASGTYYLNLHRTSRDLSVDRLPLAAAPTSDQRIVVLSPHSDDETLGLGGMIAEARRAGAAVDVAFLTNGDGFPIATGRALGEVRLAADDYIRFAEKRQQESLAALRVLDVAAHRIHFFGYPDRGLMPLWERHWDTERPFRSRYTGYVTSPYALNYTPATTYSGESLLADLRRLFRETRPTDIFVTHPADDHPDHKAAAAFVQAAVLQARDSGEPWAADVRLRYYLVHRGDWPLPQGRHEDKALLPPAALKHLDTQWETFPLSPKTLRAKDRALEQYGSQMVVMRRFLTSFIRQNEIYGTLPEIAAVAADGDAAWYPSATSLDAVGDNVVRNARPSADIRGLSVTATDEALYIRLTTRGPISPRVRYSLSLRTKTSDAENADTRFVALYLLGDRLSPRLRDRPDLDGVTVASREEALEIRLPLAALGLEDTANPDATRRVWAAAQTHWAGVPVDRTGFRSFDLERRPADAGSNVVRR